MDSQRAHPALLAARIPRRCVLPLKFEHSGVGFSEGDGYGVRRPEADA